MIEFLKVKRKIVSGIAASLLLFGSIVGTCSNCTVRQTKVATCTAICSVSCVRCLTSNRAEAVKQEKSPFTIGKVVCAASCTTECLDRCVRREVETASVNYSVNKDGGAYAIEPQRRSVLYRTPQPKRK